MRFQPITSYRRTLLALTAVGLLAGCTDSPSAPDSSTPQDPKGNEASVIAGLDAIAQGGTSPPSGRLGLIVHSASVTADGRHAIDVFLERGANVVALFSPEHGLRGEAAAGEKVSSSVDAATGLEIHSLYGKTRKPSAEALADLDTLVFDLQGGGVRFYTYVSTLLLSLEAAAENEVSLVVLDRPNPVSGLGVAGPWNSADSAANGNHSQPNAFSKRTFLAMAPGPLVHGLTLGEMARLANLELQQNSGVAAELSVVPMQHYQRTMNWRQTGRAWISPSPNLRSPEAALMYPGTALFEATNVSEGRGTKEPFLWFGAPWFDQALIDDLISSAPEGVNLRATTVRPESSPAAPKPKYLGQECRGVAIGLEASSGSQPGFDPFATAALWLSIVSQHPAFEWRDEGRALARLTGNDSLLAAIEDGQPALEQYLSELDQEHAEWLVRRSPAMLYR